MSIIYTGYTLFYEKNRLPPEKDIRAGLHKRMR